MPLTAAPHQEPEGEDLGDTAQREPLSRTEGQEGREEKTRALAAVQECGRL